MIGNTILFKYQLDDSTSLGEKKGFVIDAFNAPNKFGKIRRFYKVEIYYPEENKTAYHNVEEQYFIKIIKYYFERNT